MIVRGSDKYLRAPFLDENEIDIESEEWFMVEAELATPGTWQHIAPQVSKQLAATDSQATRDSLLKVCLEMVRGDKLIADVFADLGIPQLS